MIEKLNREKVLKRKKMNANFMRMWRMKRDEMQKKDIKVRKIEKARLKQINALKKVKASILIDLLIFIIDSKRIWKEINEMWLIEQAKKLAKKKRSRSELNTIDENDEDHEMIVDESWLQRDFVAFENLNDEKDDEKNDEKNNAKHARYAKVTRMTKMTKEISKHAKHAIVDEFLPEDFFDEYNDNE